MRAAAATATMALLLVACASKGPDVAVLPPPPPPEFPAPVQPDARLAELQTSMTELLERLDGMNARLAKLEAAQSEAPAPVSRRATDTPPAATPQRSSPA